MSKLKESEKELANLRQAQIMASAGKLAEDAERVGSTRVIAHSLGEIADPNALRNLATDLRNRLGEGEASVVAVAGIAKDRPQVVIVTNQAARELGLKAGALAKTASTILGGGGGGKDDMAQGGGQNAAALPEALTGIVNAIREVAGA